MRKYLLNIDKIPLVCYNICRGDIIMNYSTLDKNQIEQNVEKQIDFDENYKTRRAQQIIKARLKANHDKRHKQKQQKREQEKEQRARDAISVNLIKESVQKDAEILELV